MIWSLIIFFATLIGKLANDLNLYHSRKVNKHWVGAIYITGALIICSLIVGWKTAPMWFFSYWALFDTAYALLIGQKWYYTGDTAYLDKLQKQYPVIKWIKYAGFIISVVVILLFKFLHFSFYGN